MRNNSGGPAISESAHNSFYDSIDRSFESLYDVGFDEEVDHLLQSELREVDERYQLLDLVGTGGSKTIYRARDLATDAFVAVATLREDSNPNVCEQFFREARVNAALVHPNVIRVYDMGFLPDERPYFSMTLMTGQSLQARIDQSAESADDLRERLELFRKICDGVAYAHSRNVIHLDLKPQNIQIGSHGQVMVCDWGLARVLGQEETKEATTTETELDADMLTNATQKGVVKGTPGYLAPEQAAAEEKTTATDVYALGAILFALLTGHPPVSGATTEKSVRNTREGKLDLRHTGNVPKRLLSVALKALALEPQERYTTVDALEAEISRYLAGQATVAESAGPLTRLALFFQRNRLFAGSVLTAALLIVGLSAAFAVNLQHSRNDAVTARDRALESEAAAQLQAERAQEAQALAESALQKYREEEARSRELGVEVQSLEQALGRVAIFDAGFNDALIAFDAALERTPDDVRIWEQKGVVHLIRQDFAAAEAALVHARVHPNSNLLKICRRFKKLKPDDADPLTPDQAVEYLRVFPKRLTGVRVHAFRNLARTMKTPADQLVLVRGCLKILNPKVVGLDLTLTKTKNGGNHLRVHAASGLTEVCFSEPSSLSYDSVFQGLNLSSIDLTGIRIYHLADIGSLEGLESINLCDTRVRYFTNLLKCRSLRRLVVRPGQIPEEERAVIKDHLEIVVRPR